MEDDNNYGDFQSPGGGYFGNQNPGTLYADAVGTTKKDTAPAAGKATKSTPVAPAVIQVTVDPESKLKAKQIADILIKTKGLPAEFKGKVKYEKSTDSIIFPDLSKDKVVPGKEWMFDLGKAGNNWQITTATMALVLDGPATCSVQTIKIFDESYVELFSQRVS